MAILSTNQKLIKVDVGYSAGNGINITSGVISVTGDNAPYSAGQNIYFDGDDNHVINGKDWGNEINNASANAFNTASAWVAQNYANSADLTYLSGVVDNKLDASAWSSVSADMATEQYVIANGNVVFGRTTGWVNDQNYSTVSQLESVSSDLNTNKLDASSYHELTAGENIDIQNYIISSKDWTNDIQNASSNAYNESTGYVNNWIEETYSTDKNALSAAIDYVSGNAGDQEVNLLVRSNSGEWNNVSAKLDTTAYTPFDPSYMSGAIDEKLDTTAFSTVSGDFLTSIPDEYATKDFVSNSITGKLDISSFSSVSSDFLTNEDLNGYATESFVENVSGEITALIPTDYATTATTNTLSEQIEELSGTLSAKQTLSAGEGISFYDDTINNITRIDVTAQGGDPEVQGLVRSNSSTWDSVTAKQDTLTFGYDEQDRINSINSSALAGGGDVPEDVMVESAIGYNAVNEISGYNGSAIAQYGAEKQWLVHDDTLVHAANSAQYALGVNLSAVEKLTTIDLQPKVGEETFAGYWNDRPVYQRIITMPFSSNGNTTASIPSALYLSAVELGRRWIDVGQSWIHYGSENISLPITWFLGAGRQGCVSLISNSLAYRGVDNANTGCTAYICLKYRKKQA